MFNARRCELPFFFFSNEFLWLSSPTNIHQWRYQSFSLEFLFSIDAISTQLIGTPICATCTLQSISVNCFSWLSALILTFECKCWSIDRYTCEFFLVSTDASSILRNFFRFCFVWSARTWQINKKKTKSEMKILFYIKVIFIQVLTSCWMETSAKYLRLRQRFGSYFFRKRSDKMRKELEEAAREGNSMRSGSPISFPLGANDGGALGSLSDLPGTGAGGFYSDTVPSCVHMKFVSDSSTFRCSNSNSKPTRLGRTWRRSQCSPMESRWTASLYRWCW